MRFKRSKPAGSEVSRLWVETDCGLPVGCLVRYTKKHLAWYATPAVGHQDEIGSFRTKLQAARACMQSILETLEDVRPYEKFLDED